MLSVVAPAGRVTAETLVYAWLTVGTSLVLWPYAMTPVYGVAALVLGALFLREAHVLHRRVRRGGPGHAIRLFHWSNTYLWLPLVAVAVHAVVGGCTAEAADRTACPVPPHPACACAVRVVDTSRCRGARYGDTRCGGTY